MGNKPYPFCCSELSQTLLKYPLIYPTDVLLMLPYLNITLNALGGAPSLKES